MQDWDYTTPWWYYVTINTKDHEIWFGDVVNDEMKLNKFGKIANEEWLEIEKIRGNVLLDEYIVMPNHVHGIIIIQEYPIDSRDVARNVSTVNKYFSQISPKKGSLSTIIRAFKSAVSKEIHDLGYPNFKWQDRFFERIVRNEQELYKIRRYIRNNPIKWAIYKNRNDNLEI